MKKLFVSSFFLCASLVACQNKLDIIEEPTTIEGEQVRPEEQVELLEFEAELESIDEARANTLGDITLVKSNNISNTDGNSLITPEYRPSITFRDPAQKADDTGTPAVIAFCGVNKKTQAKTFYRVPVRLSVTRLLAQNKAKVKAWVKASNGVVLNRFQVGQNNQLLGSSSTWYAMIICGGEEKSNVEDAVHFELKDREQAKNTNLTTKIGGLASENGGGTSVTDDGLFRYVREDIGEKYGIQNFDFPIVSNWKELKVVETKRNNNKTLVHTIRELAFQFKPQGVFLTYHLGVNISYGIDLRRIGIVSNAVDFQGKYKLDDASLKTAFEARNANTGWGGIPAWEGYAPDAAELQGVKMYSVNQSQDPGLFGTKSAYYPWDMPLIQDAFVTTVNPKLSQLTEMSATVSEGSIAQSFPWNGPGKVDGKDVAEKKRGMSLSGFYMWTRSPGSNLSAPVGTPRDYATYIQWAMPKPKQPQANQRFTYLWVQANASFSQEDLYTGTLSSASRPKPAERLGFIQQKGVRVQPMLVVHQTNRDFSGEIGKTPHLNAVLTSDLLISELKYSKQANTNYSVIELHNTTQRSIDLSNYALVRLIDNGSKMWFRMPNGQGTDDLTKAELYYLSQIQNIKNSNMNLYYGGKDYDKQAGSVILEDRGIEHYIRRVDVDAKKLLLGGQTVLIGASGYTGTSPSIITARLSSSEDTNIKEAWCRYFVGVNSAVLNINSGEGIALVRLYNGGATKKIIDTTAPIGSSNYGFAGTYQSYKKAFERYNSALTYSQQRMDGVSFPFIAPYRTHRESTAWSDDWSIKTTSDLGDRNNIYYYQRLRGSTPYISTIGSSYFSTSHTPLRENATSRANYEKARPVHR